MANLLEDCVRIIRVMIGASDGYKRYSFHIVYIRLYVSAWVLALLDECLMEIQGVEICDLIGQ